MLTKRYTVSSKNLEPILNKIADGVAPPKFNAEHLKSIGLGSSNDRAVIPLLKDLGFLGADGTPLPRYHAFRDRSRSGAVLAEALREAYEDVFHIREFPGQADRASIEGLFRTKHNSTEIVAQNQARTFLSLLELADLSAAAPTPAIPGSVQRASEGEEKIVDVEPGERGDLRASTLTTELHYTIQVHLPATKDIEVFNSIFRSLRENLLS